MKPKLILCPDACRDVPEQHHECAGACLWCVADCLSHQRTPSLCDIL